MATLCNSIIGIHTADESAESDLQLIGKLAKIWVTHVKRGIETRMDIGSLLNERLGSPAKTQGYGQAILKKAATALHASESEINRMRWLAHLGKDGTSFWGETPEGDRTWTRFKAILPTLKPALGKKRRKASSSKKVKTFAFSGVLKVLRSMNSKLRADGFAVDAKKKSKLIEELRDLAALVYSKCAIRLHIEDLTGSPVVTPTAAGVGIECTTSLSPSPFDSVVA